ncbi:MAG: DsrE family protein [Gammaproteobacteria bacterium]|jgi:uncharacterized protein involved in oxidation of intracellular sulfur|nr:DsrE family protein [Gammaproteobacteria bacterium]
MNYLFILNDPPYGTERSYNGIRHARELLKSAENGNAVRMFLIGDAAAGARSGQKVPQGYYNIETMLQGLTRHGAEVAACGTCLDARGIGDDAILDGARRGTMGLLAEWSDWADKIVVY